MTRILPAALAAGLALSLAACAVPDQTDDTTSHVEGASFRDASALTVFIADILARSLDAPRSTLILRPYAGEDPDHTQVLLADTLRERGFALSPGGMDYPNGHVVRYAVTPMGQDLVLELDVDDAAATCLYEHDTEGALRRTGSCTLRAGRSLTLRIPPEAVLVPASPVHRPTAVVATPLPAPGPLQLHPATVPTVPAIAPQPIPAAPPQVPRPPAEVWTLVEGQPIRDQMIAWADRAGWKVLWPHNLNWIVPAMATLSGDYVTVMGTLVRTIATEGKSIRAEFHPANRFLVVTSPGGDTP